MRIDWTQTLIGSSASLQVQGDGARDAAAWALAARSAGILASGVAMGLVIALLPMRSSSLAVFDLLALSGLLLANVAGLLMARRSGTSWTPAIGLLALPFLVLSGLPVAVLVSYVLLVAIEESMVRLTTASLPRAATGAAIGGVLVGTVGALAGGIEFGGSAVLCVALMPIVIFAYQHWRNHGADDADQSAASAHLRTSAMLNALTRGSRRVLLITDTVGQIDRSGGGFAQELSAGMFPESSLVEAILIADRVAILKALSAAIHSGESSAALELRIRHEQIGAGFPFPPRYEVHSCAVYPMPGFAGRAIVVIEPSVTDAQAADESPAAPAPSQPGQMDAGLLGLALHDCTAPFNAGLGFLEMIADPRLAPRDFSTYRDFAAEAHKAISEAHRNTVLLGRWIKAEEETRGRIDRVHGITPSRLASDALRVLGLRDASERGEIRVLGAQDMPAASLNVVSARFAIEVLIRFGYRAQRCELEFMKAGHDLVVSSRRLGDEELPAADALQSALEAAAAAAGGLHFGSTDGSERHVRFLSAFEIAGVGEPELEIEQGVRLAS